MRFKKKSRFKREFGMMPGKMAKKQQQKQLRGFSGLFEAPNHLTPWGSFSRVGILVFYS